jgi:phosphoheptose isomerase
MAAVPLSVPFATELALRFTKDRPAYPAICLSGDGGLLTAADNDYRFEEVFARQVAAFCLRGDVLMCSTTELYPQICRDEIMSNAPRDAILKLPKAQAHQN